MGTLVEEILSRKTGRQIAAGEVVLVDVDYMMTHDNTSPLAIKAWRATGKPIKDPDRIVIHFDHAYPAPNILAATAQKRIREVIVEQGIKNFLHQGICHQVMIEEGYATPGSVIIGGDSHSTTMGSVCAFAVGFGSTEIGVAWATGKTWFKVPETINVKLEGSTREGVTAKDVTLYVIGHLGMNGATYKSLEFSGSYIDDLPMHDRIIFPNMSTEAGAKCGLIAVDAITIAFLQHETNAREPFERIVPRNPVYERVLEIDVGMIEPQVACHPTVDNVKPLSDVEGTPIDQVFIGTCTNGRYEDIEEFANLLKGKKVHSSTRAIVTPASQKIFNKLMDHGFHKILTDAGCTVTGTGCGACIGRHGGILADGEKAFTTMNRNFIGRMGSPKAEIYLGSPQTAAATALTGKITDPRSLL